jgi:hypothetical protein
MLRAVASVGMDVRTQLGPEFYSPVKIADPRMVTRMDRMTSKMQEQFGLDTIDFMRNVAEYLCVQMGIRSRLALG